MTVARRTVLFGAVAFLVSACAGAGPTTSALDASVRSGIRISDVTVDVSAIGAQSQGRPVPAATVKSSVAQSTATYLKGQGTGTRNVRADVVITSVSLITAGQSMIIGGESIMRGTLSLVDAQTGDMVLPATQISAGGGGYAVGGIIAVATRDDVDTEMKQLAQQFAARAHVLVFGKKDA